MNMDLIKYRQMIGKKLRDQVDKNVQVDRRIAQGSNTGNIRNNVRFKNDSDTESELDLNAIKGGKFNFIKDIKKAGKSIQNQAPVNVAVSGGKINVGKSLKHLGNSIGKDLGKGAKMFKDTAIKTGATMAGKEAGEYLYSGLKEAGKNMMNYAPEIAEEAGMTVAENPELLLAAAGMQKVKKEKKEKRPRKVSDKEKRRHALVSKLMIKYNISLPEASKLIKSKNMQY